MDRLAAMEAFVRVVDAGSFSGAAKQLRIGQPAVYTRWASLWPPDAVSFKPTERNHRRSNATSLETVQNPREEIVAILTFA